MSAFRAALNASTLFPFRLTLPEQIHVAAEAGYEGLELWARDLIAYVEEGGSVEELKRMASDAGIEFAGAIAFWRWADTDGGERKAALELAEREAELLAGIGCPSAAAPPYGQVEGPPETIAACYRELVSRIRPIGVDPVLEFWGRANKLSTLQEAADILERSGVSDAKLLVDPFHMYTGGSKLEDLSLLGGGQIGIVHVNDYPAEPPRESIQDRDRTFPGEGVFPGERFAELLRLAEYRGFLSLELFVPDYGGQTALDVARRGLTAMKRVYNMA